MVGEALSYVQGVSLKDSATSHMIGFETPRSPVGEFMEAINKFCKYMIVGGLLIAAYAFFKEPIGRVIGDLQLSLLSVSSLECASDSTKILLEKSINNSPSAKQEGIRVFSSGDFVDISNDPIIGTGKNPNKRVCFAKVYTNAGEGKRVFTISWINKVKGEWFLEIDPTLSMMMSSLSDWQVEEYLKKNAAKQVPSESTAKSQPEPDAPSESIINSRYGKFSANYEDKLLLFNGRPVPDAVAGNNSLTLEKIYQLTDKDVLLVGSLGGTACPMEYQLITVSAQKELQASESFGTCSDLPTIKQVGERLIINMPVFVGPFGSDEENRNADGKTRTYIYHDGQVKEISR